MFAFWEWIVEPFSLSLTLFATDPIGLAFAGGANGGGVRVNGTLRGGPLGDRAFGNRALRLAHDVIMHAIGRHIPVLYIGRAPHNQIRRLADLRGQRQNRAFQFRIVPDFIGQAFKNIPERVHFRAVLGLAGIRCG